MPLLETRGAASVQGFGALAASARNYIEDVFSTYLYTGNGSTQTITNGIDLAGKGGLVWTKRRDAAADHALQDTAGYGKYLITNSTLPENGGFLTSFNAAGFTLTSDIIANRNAATYVSWTFRKQAKFFDVVTYTGDGVAGRTVAHNLGSVPGCIIVKRTDNAGQWYVYHRGVNGGSSPQNYYLWLNSTNAQAANDVWNNQAPTSSVFYLGGAGKNTNDIGSTYVAYLFAHDAGGFGASGSDNVISCGSYTGNSSSQSISIGYEPQWILVKNITNVSDWQIIDVMRGMSYTSFSPLYANLSNAETTGTSYRFEPTATGWNLPNAGAATYNTTGNTYIYIAIRRGPMKTPTTGTSVFAPVTYTGNATARNITGFGFPPDLSILDWRDSGGASNAFTYDRLRGANIRMFTNTTAAEINDADRLTAFGQDGVSLGTLNPNLSGGLFASWNFRRAPGFFDEVCYTGDGVGTGKVISHNLSVVPELIITKTRNGATNWRVWSSLFSNQTSTICLNLSDSTFTNSWFNQLLTHGFGVGMTATQYSTATGNSEVNGSGNTYVAYLFATVAGVSKVFSYTGNGTSQTINCGFTGGARFVLIKRTDSTGDWYVWDSARGIVAGNDPHLSLNSAAAEVTTDDSVDTDSTGFVVNQLAATNVNVNAATYIGLAIA